MGNLHRVDRTPGRCGRTGVVTGAHRRIGAYHAAGAITATALAGLLWPWGGILLWPAVSLTVVASAYWRSDPGAYRKTDGVVSLWSRIALGPVLIGQYLSLRHYSRRCRAWDIVTPRVWMGRRLSAREARRAIRRGVRSVLDLSVELSEARPMRRIAYRHLPVLDLTAPTTDQLDDAVTFIRRRTHEGVVYVHCKIGYSRSAAIVGAYLMATGRAASSEEAVGIMRSARPGLVVRPEVLAALRAFEPGAAPRR